jgi:restriction endonuclease Mrr
MDKEYLSIVVDAAEQKLVKAGIPITDSQLIPGIVSILKKKLGKTDSRHSSKIRFKQTIFKTVISSSEWKEKIYQLKNGKFALKKDAHLHAIKTDDEKYNWHEIKQDDAVDYVLEILKEMNPYKFEELVEKVLKKSYEGYSFEVTSKSGDGGIDIIGKRDDVKNTDKLEIVFVQVKKFEGTVGRGNADSFIGASTTKLNELGGKTSKFDGLFVTTGVYPSSFDKALLAGSKVGVHFYSWDGVRLARKMIKHGIGVRYSIDLDFWTNIDSSRIYKAKLKSNKKETTKN